MDDTERNRLDGAILEAAKPYEAFVDAVCAHAKDAFRRGAKQVRIVFYPQGGMSISDDGRELTEKQLLAMTTLRENKFKSAHERLGLAFVPHAAWLEVFSGSRRNQTRLPSTEGFCQMSDKVQHTGSVTAMFHEMSGGRHAGTVLQLLPSKLSRPQAARVTVVDACGIEWKLGKAGPDVVAEREVHLRTEFRTGRPIGREHPLMLQVGLVNAPLREVLLRRASHWNDAGVEAFAPLRSPWLTGEILVTRKDSAREFQTNAREFPPDAYEDGTVDAILGAIDRSNANMRAHDAIAVIAADVCRRAIEIPLVIRGTPYRVELLKYGRGTWPVRLVEHSRESETRQIQFDPMHPIFQVNANPAAILERLLWCVTDLIRGDVPAQVIYLELRAAIDATRKH